ncbi:MAG: hypothetical protein ACOC2W_03190 [bacterium]
MVQKFKRGNLVLIINGEYEGKEAIIQYSYKDKYGGNDIDSYSIVFTEDGNSLAWLNTKELQLIDEGGEYLLDQIKEKRKELSKRNKNIKYILGQLENGSLNSESILHLFNLIGYESKFLDNGEFHVLYSEWISLSKLFIHIKDSKTLEDAESVLTEDGKKQFNIKKVWEEFNK